MDVFIGANENSGALAGHLVVREDEANEVEQALTAERYLCSCGRVYSKESWDNLESLGVNLTSNETGARVINVESKFCAVCGNRIAVQVFP